MTHTTRTDRFYPAFTAEPVDSRRTENSDGCFLEQQLLRLNRTHAQSLTSGPLQRALTWRQQHPPKLVLKTGSRHRKKHSSRLLVTERLSKPRPSQRACVCHFWKRDQSSSTFGSISSKRFHCALVWGSFKVPHHVNCTDMY